MIAGAVLALGAAVTFAFNIAAFRRGAIGGTVAQAMSISMAIGVAMAVATVTVIGGWDELLALPLASWGMLALAGVLHFAWGRYCNFRATKAMGANLVGPVQQSSLILSLTLAVLVLGEALTPLKILGIFLVFLAPALSLKAARTESAPRAQDRPFEPKLLEGFTFALLSALGYGTSPILIRHSLEGLGVVESVGGWLIAYVAAALVLSVTLLSPGRIAHVRSVERPTARWFALSGFLVGLSQMLGFIALSFAPVTVVTPIQRLSVVIRVFASWLINRDHEVIGPRIWVATAVAMLGVLALTISTEVVIGAFGLPETLAGFLRLSWPG
jgi:drug/metabolite transporter (DMT)-like permease